MGWRLPPRSRAATIAVVTVTAAPGIAIPLLGPIEVAQDGQPRTVGGRRQRALLALLAIDRGRVVPLDTLVDELWAGAPPDGAAVTIRSYVSRLRGTFEGSAELRAVASGYTLEIDPAFNAEFAAGQSMASDSAVR